MAKVSHAQIAGDFLSKSIEEFAAGDNLQSSEKLWGATLMRSWRWLRSAA